MSLPKNDGHLHNCLQRLVDANMEAIFGDDAARVRIIQTSTGRPVRKAGDRYHRVLRVAYEKNGAAYTKKIWLKFRRGFEKLYTIHCNLYERLQSGHKIFPAPYFYSHLDGTDTCLIGMEYVEGSSLRNLLLRRLVCRKGRSLEGLFVKIGAGTRAFHDSSPTSGAKPVGELADSARGLAEKSEYLTAREKADLITHIGAAEARAEPQTRLVLMSIHNDWVLRNMLVDRSEDFHVVDLDSMRSPANSRWYDVGYFLINLESQLKYRPLVDGMSLGRLWDKFWEGYNAKESPEGLSRGAIVAITYLVKVEYLLGGTIRPPLFRIYSKSLGPRYLKTLKRSIMEGELSTLPVNT